jgi:hypothetical protein
MNMMELELQIHSDQSGLGGLLWNIDRVDPGQHIELGNGVDLIYQATHIQKGADAGEILLFLLSIPTGITTSFVAALLYDKLRHHRIKKLVVAKRQVPVEASKIEEALNQKPAINKGAASEGKTEGQTKKVST